MSRVLYAAAAALAITLLAGCGVSNSALKQEHPFRSLGEPDEVITIATLAKDAVVVTEYSKVYTLTVKAPAGEYVYAGRDLSGGSYFVSRSRQGLALTYSTGFPSIGKEKPDTVNGGLHIGADGAVSLYWFWDPGYETTTRVSAPGLAVTRRTEIDEDRRRARLLSEERERLAKAAQLEAEEASRKAAEERRLSEQDRERERRQKRLALEADFATAKSRNRVQCAGTQQCDRAFAHAQAYLLTMADMRIQVATPTLIETYNGTSEGQVSIRLLRVPTTGDRWDIVLSAWCREEHQASELCVSKLIAVYGAFVPHMQLQRQ